MAEFKQSNLLSELPANHIKQHDISTKKWINCQVFIGINRLHMHLTYVSMFFNSFNIITILNMVNFNDVPILTWVVQFIF